MNCNFGDQEDDNIRDQVIDKCVDRRLKGKYLEKGTLTVVQLQKIARAHEAAQWQVKNMEQDCILQENQSVQFLAGIQRRQ